MSNKVPSSTTINVNPDRSKSGQEILDLFEVVFKEQLSSTELVEDIQFIKSKLYNRDYIGAFGDSKKNKSYMARWSSSRALAYSSLFTYLKQIYSLLTSQASINVLSIGAGAGGEFAGLAAVFSRFMEESKNHNKSSLSIEVVDVAEWGKGLSDMDSYINEYWMYGQKGLSYEYTKKNILEMEESELKLETKKLVTLMFTTNELFREDKAKSVRFLQKLNNNCIKGCFLLVVESAGSFSHIQVGSKTFPIQFLIDVVLCGKPGQTGSWKIIESNESCWYRMNKSLDYSLKLENMRFFYRLYEKV